MDPKIPQNRMKQTNFNNCDEVNMQLGLAHGCARRFGRPLMFCARGFCNNHDEHNHNNHHEGDMQLGQSNVVFSKGSWRQLMFCARGVGHIRTGNQEIRKSRNHEIRTSGNLEIRNSGNQEITTSGNQKLTQWYLWENIHVDIVLILEAK